MKTGQIAARVLFGILITATAGAGEDSPQLLRITAYYKNLSRYSVAMRIEIFAKAEGEPEQVLEATSYRRGPTMLQEFGHLTVFSSPKVALVVDRKGKTIYVNDSQQKGGKKVPQEWEPQAVLRRAQRAGFTVSEFLSTDNVKLRIAASQPNQPTADLIFDRGIPWLRRMELLTPGQGSSTPARVVVQYDWQRLPAAASDRFKPSHYVVLHAGSLIAAPDYSGYRVVRERAPQN